MWNMILDEVAASIDDILTRTTVAVGMYDALVKNIADLLRGPQFPEPAMAF